MKKLLKFDPLARKEFFLLPLSVRNDFLSALKALERDGRLPEPTAKKLTGYTNLYEVRIRNLGQWRGFYGYVGKEVIVILHFMHKKTQKTPLKE